ncbi:MAG: serine/threonine protein kinase [Candidatus Melainabacteria bacterium]|nr:serine/threonine protein kinase [Candidatus Melainabacteria bacterium]
MTSGSQGTNPKAKRYACATCGDEFDTELEECPFDHTKLTRIGSCLAPGTILGGRFEIIELCDGGGMGTVYKATHRLMKRTVAIKTLNSTIVASGAALRRFQQEAQALSALSHNNILSIFDFFVSDDGQPYIVMDYLAGTSLEAVLAREGHLRTQRAIGIFRQACAGLGHAHQHGVIHRDIKPANIMLITLANGEEVVKIVDFGIAKLSNTEGSMPTLTNTGDVFGSPLYMSPEQCRGQALDQRSDIYSLGCVMYAALVGTPLFSSLDLMACMYHKVHDEAPAVGVSPDCPLVLGTIIRRCLAREPVERWPSMAELEEALNALLGDTSMALDRTGDIVVGTDGLVAGLQSQMRGSSKSSSLYHRVASAGSGPLIWAAGVGLIVVAILLIATISRQHHQPLAPIADTRAIVRSTDTSGVSATSGAGESSMQVDVVPETSSFAPEVHTGSTPEGLYKKSMTAGKELFSKGNYLGARQYFNAAHNYAENFGQADGRFIESLEWQGRVAEKLGDLTLAQQVRTYVTAMRKRLGRSGR